MRPRHAGFACAHRTGQEQTHVVRQFAFAGKNLVRFGNGQLLQQLAILCVHAVGVRQEDQFVRVERDRGRGGDIFQREVEDLARGRIAQRRQQHHLAEFHAVFQRRDIHLAHAPGVHQIHAVDHADGLRGNEIATRHADVGIGHGRIRQTDGQQRLDLHPDAADGFFHALHGFGIGQADAMVITAFDIVLHQPLLDLRPRAVDQNQPDTQRCQQVEIVRQLDELAVRHHFTAEGDDKRLAAERIDIRRNGAEPGDEIGRRTGWDGCHGDR